MRGTGAETLGPATWVALVRQLESSVSQLITSVNAAQETPEPRLEQLSQVMSGRLSLALQQGLLAVTLQQSTSQDLFSEIGVEAAAIDRLAGSVAGAEDQTALLRLQNTKHAGQVRDDSATNLDGRDAYTPYDKITQTLTAGVTSSLDDAASVAQRNAIFGAVLTLLALAIAIAIAFYIARSLLVPINRVREGALAVARHRLPDAVARIRAGQEPEPITTIDVTTNEEIGQVARAVDDLHRQAIHLASGEAQLRQTVNAMFVTLSRRSTSLVNQQLAQIERLEHDEEDPKRLESLFRLDHLASRMRRTADSLLILADAPNRAAGQFSLTVGEALQAATSAVQDYQRVQILSHLNTRVGDEAAADVVHLLTELVDNALTYSPPGEPVRLAAKQGDDGVTITVTDSGLGVPPAELEVLNRDLAHGAEATPDTARRMGLFVVSRLAERHGIDASLARNPGGGMTATVVLPTSVLPDLPQVAAPVAGAAARTEEPSSSTAVETVDTVVVGTPQESRRDARNRARVEKAQAKKDARATQNGRRHRRARCRHAGCRARGRPGRPGRGLAGQARRTPSARRSTACCRVASPAPTCRAPVRTPSCRPRRPVPPARSSASARTSRAPPRRPPAPRSRPPAACRRSPPSSRSPPWPPASAPRPSRPAPRSPSRTRSRSRSRSPWTTPSSTRRWPTPPSRTRRSPTSRSRSPPGPTTRCRTPCPRTPSARPRTRPRPQDERRARRRDRARRGARPTSPPTPPSTSTTTTYGWTPTTRWASARPPRRTSTSYPPRSPSPRRVTETVAEEPEPVEEPVAEEPAEEPVEEPAVAQLVEPAAPEADHALNGHGSNGHEPARAGGDSPIFKSMRSGFLTGNAEEIHETEVDRGWEIAAQNVVDTPPVAEPAVATSTVTGLPRRAPGERLVPGSVAAPTAARSRDPEAIRRRLQAHTAGVSRGRKAAQSSTQHTEAGPA